jgi:apolipoprotein N-acyltransferase
MVSSLLNWIRQSNSFWGRALLGILGGLGIAISFPAFNVWPAIFVGIALIMVAIRQLGFFKAFFVGTIAGFAFYGLILKWLTTYLGPLPWLLLSIVEALIFGVACGVMAVVWRWLLTLKLGRYQSFVIAFVLGAIYTAREYVADHFPFEGLLND